MAAPLKFATDYDLNEVMLMNMTGNLPRTDNSNRLVIQRFADFHGLLFSSLNREDFTDSNVALFLHDAHLISSCVLRRDVLCSLETSISESRAAQFSIFSRQISSYNQSSSGWFWLHHCDFINFTNYYFYYSCSLIPY